jgi:hypothetical protein
MNKFGKLMDLLETDRYVLKREVLRIFFMESSKNKKSLEKKIQKE